MRQNVQAGGGKAGDAMNHFRFRPSARNCFAKSSIAIPRPPDAEPVMPHSSCVARDNDIKGVPGILINVLEISLKPMTDPTTAPKPTSAHVLITGMAQLVAPVVNVLSFSVSGACAAESSPPRSPEERPHDVDFDNVEKNKKNGGRHEGHPYVRKSLVLITRGDREFCPQRIRTLVTLTPVLRARDHPPQ
jgi:hypothetical protein